MTDPVTIIQAAATTVGIPNVVAVGSENELNFQLDKITEFPVVAVVRVGADAVRKTLRPANAQGISVGDGSASFSLKWGCIVYLLEKSNFDDTGAVRHSDMMPLFEKGFELVSEIQMGIEAASIRNLPTTADFSVLPVNFFDANLDGVVFEVTIPATWEYCGQGN